MRRHFLREFAPLHGGSNKSAARKESEAGIFSVTASSPRSRNFFAGARKFSRLLLDNACVSAPEKISARHEISTEAVDNFWITQA
jgi:hypothetical protein